MMSILETLSVIISIVEFIMGIFGNGFIILILCNDWIRKRKSSLIDFILMGLAGFRICFLCATLSTITFQLVYEKVLVSKSVLMIVIILWTGSNYFCTASSTCLTVFYFFKIANFSNPVFLWMKQKMRVVLLVIILGSVFSFCVSLVFIDVFTSVSMQHLVKIEQNFTSHYTKKFYDSLIYFIPLNIILFIFFVVSLSSFLLLLFSLWRHTKRMKLQGMYSRDLSMEAHVRAMKAMISSLLLFITHYVGYLMIMLEYCVQDTVTIRVFMHLLLFLYPSGHPFLLILWNSKLKQASLCVLRKLKCVKEDIIPHYQK
nr:taste receptor type 2 member 7-like [Cavia porcellus]